MLSQLTSYPPPLPPLASLSDEKKKKDIISIMKRGILLQSTWRERRISFNQTTDSRHRHVFLHGNERKGENWVPWLWLIESYEVRSSLSRWSFDLFYQAPMRPSRREWGRGLAVVWDETNIFVDASATVGFTVCDPLRLINDDVRC